MKDIFLRALMRAYDIVVVVVSCYIAMILATLDNVRLPDAYMSFSWFLVILPIIYIFYLSFFKLYDVHNIVYPFRFLPAVFKSTVSTFFAFIFVSFFILKYQASRRFLTVFFTITPLLLLLRNKFVSLIGTVFCFDTSLGRKVLVVGDESRVGQFANILIKKPFPGMNVVGKITTLEQKHFDDSEHKEWSISEIEKYLDSHEVDDVIFCAPKDWVNELNDAMVVCSNRSIPFQVYANFFSFIFSDKNMEDFFGIPVFSFQKEINAPFQMGVKRIIDIVVSFVLLILLSPLFAIVAILIKLTMPGPVLFKQRRSGLGGKEFDFYKFRSMVVEAEELKESLSEQNEISGPVFKIKEDPRITWLGRILRKFSIDELPQLWNVFVGDMSLVGPRPPIPSEVEKYEPWQKRRLIIRPGITCIWQVNGRSDISFDDWVKMDLYYVDNWSLWLDLKILFKTIPAVISGDGAY